MIFTKCGDIIPKIRKDLGYLKCVNCSDEAKWSGNLVVFHKTGNSYEIIKDPEVAANVARLSSRNGFGSNRKALAKEGISSSKKIPPSQEPIIPVVIKKIPPKPENWKDEEWTLAILDKINTNKDEAIKLLDKVFNDGLISPLARKRLMWIIDNNTFLT